MLRPAHARIPAPHRLVLGSALLMAACTASPAPRGESDAGLSTGDGAPARAAAPAHAPTSTPTSAPAPAPATATSAAGAPADGTPPGREGMLADLSELGELLREHWSYLDDKREHFGVDPDLAISTARAALDGELDGEPDAGTFLDALQRCVASLQDGHALVRAPGAEDPPFAWPFTLVPAAEGLVVEGVAPMTLAAMDVEPGDRLLAVDLVAANELLSHAMRRTMASTLGSRRARAAGRMRWTDRERSRFLMQKPGGRLYELDFDAVPRGTVVPAPACYAPGITWGRFDGRTGWLRVGTFAAPDAEAWAAAAPGERDDVLAPYYDTVRSAFAELSGLDGLVLDLRRNTGGTDLAGMEVARHLVPPGSVYFRLQGRLEDGSWSPVSEHPLPDEPPEHPFEGRLVVLIDEWTFSTADNLAACLDDLHPDARFVGRPTAGGTGAPRPFVLPNTGAEVAFCTMRVERPHGGLIEGRGTTPDVLVTWEGADLAAGRDPDMAAARALLDGTAAPGR